MTNRLSADLEDEPEEGDARDRSLSDDVRQLADDARAYALAEAGYQKARAVYFGKGLTQVGFLGVLALFLVFFALMGLTFGAVLALLPQFGGWAAGGLVFAALLAGALLLAGTAMLIWNHVWRNLQDRDAPQ